MTLPGPAASVVESFFLLFTRAFGRGEKIAMGRLRSLLAVLAALVAGAGSAAEVTRVSSSGEPESAFDLAIAVRFERIDRRAAVSREFGDRDTGRVGDESELRYSRVTSRLVPRLALGLWHDLELRAELPYVLADDTSWKDSGAGGTSSISANPLTPDGGLCATQPCPMFPVGKTLYAGGLDDLRIGVAWGILNERRAPWIPSWVVSLDVTAPTAPRWDPAAGRLDAASFFDAPSFAKSQRVAVGRKIWVYDLGTALSKRMGPVDPYFTAHLRIPQRSPQTYSNCDHAAELAAIGQMSGTAAARCQLPQWKEAARADPPLTGGMAFGLELVPYEDKGASQKWAVDVRLGGDYVSRGRWYNELTAATGKLLASEPYFTASARLGTVLQASRYVLLGVAGDFQYDLPHFITGETQFRQGLPDENPNYDWRWDPAGRRFRVSEVLAWSVSATAQLRF